MLIALSLNIIKHFRRNGCAVDTDTLVNDLAEIALLNEEVDLKLEHAVYILGVTLNKAEILRNRIVEDDLTESCRNKACILNAVDRFLHADLDR